MNKIMKYENLFDRRLRNAMHLLTSHQVEKRLANVYTGVALQVKASDSLRHIINNALIPDTPKD